MSDFEMSTGMFDEAGVAIRQVPLSPGS